MSKSNGSTSSIEDVSLDQVSKQNKLLFGLKHIQDRYYLSKCAKELFVELLQYTLEATDSPWGCIAELKMDADQPYLNMLAATDTADDEMRARLTAHLLQKDDVLIYNAPQDKGSDLQSFIGLPARLDENLIGVVCLANRAEGYTEALIDFLEPMRTTFTSLLIFRQLNAEKLKAEQRQLELNNHLHSLLESVDDIVLEANGNMVLLNVWVRDEKLLFMPREQFLNKTIGEVMGPLAENMVNFIQAAIDTGEAQVIEYAHVNPEVNIMFRARASIITHSNDPEKTKIALTVRDVTEQQNQQQQLEKAKINAEQAAQAKGNFLSVMSHEIRTPLNGIIGISNLLSLNHTDEQKELVDNLIFSSNHLLKLVNDILDLSKIDSDNLELQVGPLNLHRLVDNINSTFMQMADAKGLGLNAQIDTDIPEVIMADAVRISQVLNNLVSNALKFTDEGEVSVSISLIEKTTEKVKLHFAVKDTGIGIPAELQDEVFESFRQVQQHLPQKDKGTGLGLAITKRLVALHNSTIELKSAKGEGTEFSFDITFGLLGAENVDKTKAPVDAAQYKEDFASLNFLLVEDNPVNIMVARKQLEYFGITPDAAQNGNEALALMRDKKYDIALVDLHMPEMDGFELSACIRKDYPATHIVIFTADIMTEARDRVAKLNIHNIISKPFVPAELLDILIHVVTERNG